MDFIEQDHRSTASALLIEIDAKLIYVQLFSVNIHLCLLFDLWLSDCTVSLQLFLYSEEERLLSLTGQQASLVVCTVLPNGAFGVSYLGHGVVSH